MSDLEDLYKQVILDHAKRPRRQGTLPAPPARMAEGYNPLCGDEVKVYLDVEDGAVATVRIDGRGCSISQASASMMTDVVEGRSVDEVRDLAGRFRAMMSDVDEPPPDRELKDAQALSGVRNFPVRIKCALLPWVTLEQGLNGEAGGSATTE